MKKNKPYILLEDAARDHIPDTIDLTERILTQIKKDKSPMNTRFKLAVSAITLLTLAVAMVSLPGVARSMQKLFGYIPGIGAVDQSTPIRRLPDPVAQTRAGITVTIDKVILDAQRTTVHFKVEGIPASAYPQHLPGSDPQGFQKACDETLYLRLPDGTLIQRDGPNAISGHVGVKTYEASFMLAPIPAGIDQATLVMPCILGVEQEAAPENWEFGLRFVTGADPSTIPMIELQTPTAQPGAVSPQAGAHPSTAQPSFPSQGISLMIEKMVSLPDGDILYGRLEWDKTVPYSVVTLNDYTLTDAKGQRIPIMEVSPDPAWVPGPGSHSVPLAFKMMAPVQNPGLLTLTATSLYANLPVRDTEFPFDTGPDPRDGQEWAVDKEFSAGGYTIHLHSVLRTADGYDFIFQPSDEVQCIDLVLSGPEAVAGECGQDHTKMRYDGSLPSGALRVSISNLEVRLDGNWQVTWKMPE